MIHGMDHFITGMKTAICGDEFNTVSSQLLQGAGLSSQTASFIDNGISLAGTMGAAGMVRAGETAASSNFRLPSAKSLSFVRSTNDSQDLDLKKINNAVRAIDECFGGKGKIIMNADNDLILVQGDKKIRFDVNNTHGFNPHFHIEKQKPNGRWVDEGIKHRYYFSKE